MQAYNGKTEEIKGNLANITPNHTVRSVCFVSFLAYTSLVSDSET